MLGRIPPSSTNPHDRRGELLERLETGVITRQEAEELRDLVQRDLERSSQDEVAKKRLSEVKANPSIGKSEQELDDYLKKRGVNVD